MEKSIHATGEIRSLTGLRGIAALFVVLFHALHSSSPLAGFILGKGYLSVDIFFVLSGYVMALTYGRVFGDGKATLGDYTRFLGFRFARIYPLYIVMTLLTAALGWMGAMPLYFVDSLKWSLPWNVTLLQSLSFGIAGNIDSPAWSLSTEWVAYLIFPLLAGWILSGNARRLRIIVGLVVATLIGLWIASLLPIPGAKGDGPLGVFETTTLLPVLRCIAGFGLGMVAWRAQGEAFGITLASRPIYGDLLALALFALLFIQPGDVAFVLLAAMLVLHLASSKSLASTALGTRAVHYLGLISYSIYLVHWPVILVLRTLATDYGFHPGLTNLAAVAATLLVAPLTYRYIEVPGRAMVRRLLERRRAIAPAG